MGSYLGENGITILVNGNEKHLKEDTTECEYYVRGLQDGLKANPEQANVTNLINKNRDKARIIQLLQQENRVMRDYIEQEMIPISLE